MLTTAMKGISTRLPVGGTPGSLCAVSTEDRALKRETRIQSTMTSCVILKMNSLSLDVN